MEEVDRFRADLEPLIGGAPSEAQPLGIAVSGGGDSLALLLLAHRAYPGAVAAATVDHGLRAEAAGEARYVAGLCADRGIPHQTLRLGPHRSVSITNIQERARRLRYLCLHEWASERSVGHVAVAHHRDDLAETLLMRANRGAGVRGLAAMRPSRTLLWSAIMLVRPLLSWRRAELAAVVAREQLVPVADPSNDDRRFERARMRALLADHADLLPDQLARTAEHLRDVEEAIEWQVQRDLNARLEEGDCHALWLDASDLPFELKRRFVLRAIQGVRSGSGRLDDWRQTGVATLVRALEAGSGGTIAEVQARVLGGRWHFRPSPPRRAG